MAGFQGFEGFDFDSSADIKAEFDAGLQQALTSGDQHQMRSAIVQQAANTLSGGSPEFRQAKKREQVLADAMVAGKDRAEALGETDEIANEILYYEEAQQAAVDAELPEMAMVATMQLSKLRLIQEEREKLSSAEARAAAKEARDAEGHALQIAVDRVTKRHLTNGMLVNPDDLSIHGRYDLNEAEEIKAMSAAQKENQGLMFVTEGDFINLSEAEKDRKRRLSSMADLLAGRSGLNNEWFKKTQSTDAFAVAGDDLVDLLLDPNAETIFAAGGSARGMAEKIGSHARSLFSTEHHEFEDGDSPEQRFDQVMKAKPELASTWNRLSSDRKALTMELGYALATSREGGRLTDQDVERAIVTLGLDNPDPAAIAWIFGRALKRTRDVYSRSLVTSGVSDLPLVQEAHASTMNQLDNTIARLESKYQIDYDDEKAFDKLINPTADNANLDDEGVNVRLVSPDNRGPRRRVVD